MEALEKSLELINLDMPAMVSTTLNIYDITDHLGFSEDMDPVFSAPVTLFPTGLTAETAIQEENPKNSNETVLADTDDFTVTFLYGEQDPNWPNTGYNYLLRLFCMDAYNLIAKENTR